MLWWRCGRWTWPAGRTPSMAHSVWVAVKVWSLRALPRSTATRLRRVRVGVGRHLGQPGPGALAVEAGRGEAGHGRLDAEIGEQG